jgi:capsular polysaccharide biosynthesis protein
METVDAQPRGWDEGPGLLQSAWRYNWIVAVAALIGAVLGYGWASRQPILYQASSRLLFGPTSATLSGQAEQPSSDPERYLNNQVQLITSSEVLERAAKRSGVAGASADGLAAQMTVVPAQNTDVITISVLDSTPKGAADLANAVGAAYQAYVADQPRKVAEGIKSVNNRLQDQLNEINGSLAATPPPADADTLRLLRDAIRNQQEDNAKRFAAITAAGSSNPVQLQEEAAVPGQPAQPATRRTAAIGLLFGLVGGVALAWLLSTRRMAGASMEWPVLGSARRRRRAGGDLMAAADGATARPVEARTDDRRFAAEPSGNGVKIDSAVAPLARRLTQEHDAGLDQVQGSGSGGRVRAEDGEVFVQQRQRSSPAAVDEAAGGKPPEASEEGLIDTLARLEAALADEPLRFYAEFLPQVMADELTKDAFADLVAVLLDDGAGAFEVVGAVGLAADEQHAAVDQRHDVLRQAHQDGVSVFEDASRLGAAAAGIPGSRTADAFMLVPLVQGPSWIGVLLVGRRSDNGRRATPFDDQEIEALVQYATDCMPVLYSLLLFRRLQQSLAVLDPSQH